MSIIASLIGTSVLIYLVIRGGVAVVEDFRKKPTPPATQEDKK